MCCQKLSIFVAYKREIIKLINKTDMIMKTEKIYSWVLRISNCVTGEVEYRTRMYLTATEIEQEANTLLSSNRDLYVSIFKLHKML